MKDNINGEITLSPVSIKHKQVITFAKAMDVIPCENDYKGGWKKCPMEYLRNRLIEEVGEYFAWVNGEDGWKEEKINRQKKELIDIANFVLMLWDRSKFKG